MIRRFINWITGKDINFYSDEQEETVFVGKTYMTQYGLDKLRERGDAAIKELSKDLHND